MGRRRTIRTIRRASSRSRSLGKSGALPCMIDCTHDPHSSPPRPTLRPYLTCGGIGGGSSDIIALLARSGIRTVIRGHFPVEFPRAPLSVCSAILAVQRLRSLRPAGYSAILAAERLRPLRPASTGWRAPPAPPGHPGPLLCFRRSALPLSGKGWMRLRIGSSHSASTKPCRSASTRSRS